MAVSNVTREEFDRLVKTCLSINPVDTQENLMGREAKLALIDRSLATPGRSVFIFGDRGVGKTSLARTSGKLVQSAGTSAIQVGCSNASTFVGVLQIAVRRMYAQAFNLPTNDGETNESTPKISSEMLTAVETGKFGRLSETDDIIDMLFYVSSFYPSPPTVIIDEFNELDDVKEKKKFADFAKQLTDQSVPIKVIFCGVGASKEELLGLHASSGRSIMPIELERLDDSALWSIMNRAEEVVGLPIDRETVLRTAILSDGFPYFVHLVTEYMLWDAFNSTEKRTHVTIEDFGNAVISAIPHADSVLKDSYLKATKKYKNSEEYEDVLWAYADSPTLSRQSNDVYSSSYARVFQQRNNIRLKNQEDLKEKMSKEKFDQRLAKLKKESHGSILHWRGAGWYEFRENMMRGYVRIKALEAGVDLGIDHYHANQSARQLRELTQGRS